jgi:hypothetical protein
MSQFTFDDLRIRTAEFLSSAYHGTAGTSAAAVPTEVYSLDVVNRVVNDGYKRFLHEHDWVFMTPLAELSFVTETTGSVTTGGTGTFTDSAMTDTTGTHNGKSLEITRANGSTFHTIVVTQTSAGVYTFADGSLVFTAGDTYTMVAAPAIRGRADRYAMPADFGGNIRGQITYGGPAGTPRIALEQVSDDRIRELTSGDVNTAAEPVAIAFRPLAQEAPSDEAIIEAVVWPTPQAVRTIKFRYHRQPVPLVLGTDRPVSGFIHDMTLLAAIKAEAEVTRHDEIGVWEGQYKTLLATSKIRDSEQRPKSLGMMKNPEGSRVGFPFFRGTTDNINGTEITF